MNFGNIGTWLKGHKPEAALGVGGIGVTIFLAYKSRQSSASSSSAGTTSSGLFGSSSAVPVSTADTTDSDAFNGIEDQVLGLQQAVLAGAATPAAATATTPAATTPAPTSSDPYAGETLQGSGYGPSGGDLTVTAVGGQSYTGIPSAQTAGLLLASGTPLDYQPGEGVFDPVVAGLAPGTPLFVKDPSS